MTTEVKAVITIVLITIVVIVGGIFLLDGQTGAPKDIVVNSDILVRPDSPTITAEQNHITIVEFADYECPSCAVLHPQMKKLLESEDGKYINFVFRNFPLHGGSVQASVAVQAAGAQGKYWEMHDKLFVNQDEWASVAYTNTSKRAQLFEKYATEIGLDIAKYRTDLKNDAYKDLVDRDKADAISMNVNATPTLIVNGTEVIRGAVSYEQLKEVVDAELAKNN